MILTAFAVSGVHASTKEPGDASEAPLSLQDQAFKTAFDAMSRRQWTAFEKSAAKVSQRHLLYDYITYWRLRQALNEADTPDPDLDQRVRAFIKANPKSVTGDLLRKKWMLELGEREQWPELLTHLPDWQRRNDTRVFCQAGRARLALEKQVGEQAIDAFNRDRNLGTECGPLAQEMLDAGVVDLPTLRRRMWRALEVRDWRSVKLLVQILGVSEADAKAALKKPNKVLKRFESIKSKLTDQHRDQLVIAMVRLARPKPTEAAHRMEVLDRHFRQIEKQYLWSQIAASAMRDMIPQAYLYTLKAQGGPITDITRVWLARAALRQKDWTLLMRIIGRMGSDSQASPTWLYWRARALKETGAKHGAHALLKQIRGRHHFYGELAAEELGGLISAPKSAPAPSKKLISKVSKRHGFVRARKFYEMGIRYQGNREWNFQVRSFSDEQLIAAATAACDDGLLERCISTAVRTKDQHDFALRFISPYRKELAAVAQQQGLNLSWVYGLIRQESRFVDDARSSAGARGLMQIMPSTGKWIAGKLGVRNYNKQDLLKRATNVKFGTFYLRTVYDNLQGSPLLASAAYNAGPKRPRRWMSTLSTDVDGALFVEIIPFAQTRTYVKKVLLNTAYYESVFSGKGQSLKSLLGKVPAIPYEETKIP